MAVGDPVNQPRVVAHRRPVAAFWWLRRRSYLRYALRELSCVFVAWFVLFLVLLVGAVSAGEEQYRAFLRICAEPWMLGVNVTALLFVVLHAVTWFGQTPSAVVIRRRGRRVRPAPIIVSLYLLWAALSAATAVLVLGG